MIPPKLGEHRPLNICFGREMHIEQDRLLLPQKCNKDEIIFRMEDALIFAKKPR
jgi:hypothetical protein